MEKEIIVENKEEFFNKIIANYKPLGWGAEGTAYQMGSNVIKILNGYDNRKHSKDEYLQFSDIKSKYFYFTKKVYLCDGQVISVVGNTCPGKNLLQIDPLKININKFIKNYTDLKEEAINLTNKNIFFFDVQFNCMYSPNKMGIIDTSDFAFTDRNPNQLLIDNLSIIQTCYLDFIIKGYFEYFIEHTPLLKKCIKK